MVDDFLPFSLRLTEGLHGIHFGGRVLVVALGIAESGEKHVLGVWQGATENTTVVKGLLEDGSVAEMRANGSGSKEILLDGDRERFPCSWSPDGQDFLYLMRQVLRGTVYGVPAVGYAMHMIPTHNASSAACRLRPERNP